METAIMVGGFALFLVVTTLLILICLFVREHFRSGPAPHQETDLTNMMILFQTMRDILVQQKDLARDFNRSLDKRVKQVRELAELVREERKRLQETQREIAELLAATGDQLAGLERRFHREPEPAAEAKPAPHPENAEHDMIDSWTGLDFGGDTPDPESSAPQAATPVEPEDAEAARAAFRSLLDLQAGGDPEYAGPAARAAASGPSGNGHAPPAPAVPPVQQRVYEYADAGMSVAEISRELGIGKGEVRLILSLRTGKSG